MKGLTESVRNMVVVSAVSLMFAAPVLAQQEVNPDRFEAAAAQNGQHATQVQKKSANVSAKRQTAKVRHSSSAGSQRASSKSSPAYTELASK